MIINIIILLLTRITMIILRNAYIILVGRCSSCRRLWFPPPRTLPLLPCPERFQLILYSSWRCTILWYYYLTAAAMNRSATVLYYYDVLLQYPWCRSSGMHFYFLFIFYAIFVLATIMLWFYRTKSNCLRQPWLSLLSSRVSKSFRWSYFVTRPHF